MPAVKPNHSATLTHRSRRTILRRLRAHPGRSGCTRSGHSSQTREACSVLRLVAHTTATISRLVPLIAGFKRAHPKVALDVTLTERPVDLVADGYDLGIVVPYMVTSETTLCALLERIPLVICATPEYLQTLSIPRHPMELANHHFVLMSPSIRRLNIDFRNGERKSSVPRRFDISSNSPAFNLEMVLQGSGVGVVPEDLVDKELASGKLVRRLSEFQLIDDSVEIRLAYSNRTLLPAKVRAFVEYAAAFFGALATSR